MRKNEIAIEVKDFRNRVVVWYKESYEDHMKRHKDVRKCFNKFYVALQNPDLIEDNTERQSLDLYALVRSDKKGENLYLKVVVDYNNTPAFIRTVHLTSDTGRATICL